MVIWRGDRIVWHGLPAPEVLQEPGVVMRQITVQLPVYMIEKFVVTERNSA
jgi:hypothetical protein